MTGRRRYVTRDPPAGSTVRDTSVCFTRCSRTCCQPVQITQHKLPLFRTHAHLRRLSHILMVQYRRREPASPTRFPSIRVQFRRREHAPRALFPIGHGPISATGTRANSAVLLSRGINSATGGRVSNAAPLNHGRGACASGTAPPVHASRNNTDAATARRSLTRKCSPSPRSDRVATVGLRCGKASSCLLYTSPSPRD